MNRNKRCPFSPFLFIILEVKPMQEVKKKNSHADLEEMGKLSIFKDNIFYMESQGIHQKKS